MDSDFERLNKFITKATNPLGKIPYGLGYVLLIFLLPWLILFTALGVALIVLKEIIRIFMRN